MAFIKCYKFVCIWMFQQTIHDTRYINENAKDNRYKCHKHAQQLKQSSINVVTSHSEWCLHRFQSSLQYANRKNAKKIIVHQVKSRWQMNTWNCDNFLHPMLIMNNYLGISISTVPTNIVHRIVCHKYQLGFK